jgi:D-galactarolactone isomerase
MPVPHSTATAPPQHRVPALACDAHLHILDSGLDPRTTAEQDATVVQYRSMQALLGTQRAVVVQPRPYGTDHRVTLDAIARLGLAHTRGIAVVHPDVPEKELHRLHQGGIRGVRMSLYTAHNAVVGFDMLEALAHKVHTMGWHLQLHWTADQIAEHARTLLRLPVTLVFDHLARLPVPQGIAHPAYAVVRELLQQGRAWVKLSGAYLNTALPPGKGYADVQDMARAWVQLAPERLVWGSDWPHTTETHHKPDDSGLLDLLYAWTGSPEIAERILVDNPAKLYGFDSF